jgi:pilus assembly protein CpaD
MGQKANTATVSSRGSIGLGLAAGLMCLGLAACTGTYRAEIVGAVPDDYRLNHPITIEETLATFDIPVGRETRYLARGMEDNVLAFANGFLRSGSNAIAIVLPTGSANAATAAAISVQVEGILLSAGIPAPAIQYRSYPASALETQAPIRLAYVRIAAATAPCGPWTDNVARNYENVNYAAFGCATQQNFAAMVANPLDLLYPRVMTPPNAGRRHTVLENYQAGQPTATAHPQAATITGIDQ